MSSIPPVDLPVEYDEHVRNVKYYLLTVQNTEKNIDKSEWELIAVFEGESFRHIKAQIADEDSKLSLIYKKYLPENYNIDSHVVYDFKQLPNVTSPRKLRDILYNIQEQYNAKLTSNQTSKQTSNTETAISTFSGNIKEKDFLSDIVKIASHLDFFSFCSIETLIDINHKIIIYIGNQFGYSNELKKPENIKVVEIVAKLAGLSSHSSSLMSRSASCLSNFPSQLSPSLSTISLRSILVKDANKFFNFMFK